MDHSVHSDSAYAEAKNPTKRDRFVRVAEQRTQKVLDDLVSLSKCAAKVSYEYTDTDVEQILAAIEQGVQRVRETFAGHNRFSLTDHQKSNGTFEAVVKDAQQRANYQAENSDIRGLASSDKLPEGR